MNEMTIFVVPHFHPSNELKLKYSEKGHKISRNLHLTLAKVHTVKSKLKISQNFVAFSEYMNFKLEKVTTFHSFSPELVIT